MIIVCKQIYVFFFITNFTNFKIARTINLFDSKTSSTKQIQVIAENETSYKTIDNKTIKKEKIADSQLKNTIDYRYTEVDNNKYAQLQKSLCIALEIDVTSDIRTLASLFNITASDNIKRYFCYYKQCVLLNRRNYIEIMLTKQAYNSVCEMFECDIIAFDKKKYSNKIECDPEYPDIKSCKLCTQADIKKFLELTK